jgi:hypothetical protein
MKVNRSPSVSRKTGVEPTTVRPPFDPEEFARQSERTTVPPPPGLPSYAPGISSGTMDALEPVEGTTVPTLAIAVDDLEWFDLPPLARRMLRHVDGSARLDEICSKTGDSVDDAICVVEQLMREGLLSRR